MKIYYYLLSKEAEHLIKTAASLLSINLMGNHRADIELLALHVIYGMYQLGIQYVCKASSYIQCEYTAKYSCIKHPPLRINNKREF